MKNLFGESYEEMPRRKPKPQDKIKRSWENAFQKWSNDTGFEGNTRYGVCGFGMICDYCEENHYGRPCVRALNEMCRIKRLSINYTDKSEENFKKWFDGGK